MERPDRIIPLRMFGDGGESQSRFHLLFFEYKQNMVFPKKRNPSIPFPPLFPGKQKFEIISLLLPLCEGTSATMDTRILIHGLELAFGCTHVWNVNVPEICSSWSFF